MIGCMCGKTGTSILMLRWNAHHQVSKSPRSAGILPAYRWAGGFAGPLCSGHSGQRWAGRMPALRKTCLL